MSQLHRVQVIDYRNGAYPISEIINNKHVSQSQEAIKQLLGNKIQVQDHCNLYYKATVEFDHTIKKVILICKKDCLLLQTN